MAPPDALTSSPKIMPNPIGNPIPFNMLPKPALIPSIVSSVDTPDNTPIRILPKTSEIAAFNFTFKIRNKITTIDMINAQNNHAECDINPPSSTHLTYARNHFSFCYL